MNKLDVTGFVNFRGKGLICSPRSLVYIGDQLVQCHDVNVTQNGHQDADSCMIAFPNTDHIYDDFVNLNKSTIEVLFGYDIFLGGKKSFYGERIFYGVSTKKELIESKQSGSCIKITAKDFSVIATEAKMTGIIDGLDIESIIRLLSDRVYGENFTKNHLILNIPEGLKAFKYGEYSGSLPLEIDQKTFWGVATEIASDFGFDSYFTTDGEWYFGQFATEDDPTKIKISRFIRNTNVSSLNIAYKNPSSITNKIRYTAYDDSAQEMVTSETSVDENEIVAMDQSWIYPAQQNHTLNLTNDKMHTKSVLTVLAKIRLWEEMRQIKTISFSSEYGIPYIKAGGIIDLSGYSKHDGYYFVRSVNHSISKGSGYKVNITAEVPNPFTHITILDENGLVVDDPLSFIEASSVGGSSLANTEIGDNCPEGGLIFPADGDYNADDYDCWKRVDEDWTKIDCNVFLENDQNYRVSYVNRFGYRIHPITHIWTWHLGIDIDGKLGAEVYAAQAGVIEKIGNTGDYGNSIVIRLNSEFKVDDTSELQDDGGVVGRNGTWYILYSHLDSFKSGLKVGSSVGQGQVIGFIGSTGLALGDHLHFELYKDIGNGKSSVDPAPCIAGIGVSPGESTGDVGLTGDTDDSEDLSENINVTFNIYGADKDDLTEKTTIKIDNEIVAYDGSYISLERNKKYSCEFFVAGYESLRVELYYTKEDGNTVTKDVYMQKIKKLDGWIEMTVKVKVSGETDTLDGSVSIYLNDEYIGIAPVKLQIKVDTRYEIRIKDGDAYFNQTYFSIAKEKDDGTTKIITIHRKSN